MSHLKLLELRFLIYRKLEKEMATHSSFLAFEKSMDRRAWQATVCLRSQKVRYDWATITHSLIQKMGLTYIILKAFSTINIELVYFLKLQIQKQRICKTSSNNIIFYCCWKVVAISNLYSTTANFFLSLPAPTTGHTHAQSLSRSLINCLKHMWFYPSKSWMLE